MSDDRWKLSRAEDSFDAKIELLWYLLAKEGIEARSTARISRRSLSDSVSLSFAQERLWFLEQLHPASGAYLILTVERLLGFIDIPVFLRSIETIVARHEILRTNFLSVDGSPVAVVREHAAMPCWNDEDAPSALDLPYLKLIDLSNGVDETRNPEFIATVYLRSQPPLDLARDSLFQVHLVVLGQNDYLVAFRVHQMIYDWWSHLLLSRQIKSLYDSALQNNRISLSAEPIDYVDFAAWQRQWLRGETLQHQIGFWRQRLENSLPQIKLPADRPRPTIQSLRGARCVLTIDESLTLALKELSRREQVTVFVCLIAALNVLLYRYSGQEDLVVGFPAANRSGPETENVIGFFVNTLVLRTDLSGNPSFNKLLKRTQMRLREALDNGDVPFEKVVEDLHLSRDLGRNPLFQIMFIFQGPANPRLQLSGLTSYSVQVDTLTSKFDLTLSLNETNGGLDGYFEYSTELFNHSTIERMIGHYQTLLQGIIDDPHQCISELPLLTGSEKEQLLINWNDTAVDYPRDKCISELFEDQAGRTPDAIAAKFKQEQLTYYELNERANQLAHYLQGLGVGPEKLVGLCVRRSLEMVVGLLGILKAGGTYVPLDPSHPVDRLACMLEAAQVSIVVTQESLVSSTRPSLFGTWPFQVCLDRDWPSIRQGSIDNPKTEANSENVAYVLYTSGSSGKPKGVRVTHRSVVNCLHSIGQQIDFTNRDVLLAVTTISFDIAALELFLPLLFGGTVALTRRDDVVDGTELRRRLEESSVTIMQGTPSIWRLLIEAGWQGSPDFKILCGGEVMSRVLAEALLSRGNVWNLYGPTETTIWSTVYKVESGEGPVPIGRPIANTRIYILDCFLQPVPIGVPGELYIGGAGLARDYWDQPELTAENFVPNHFIPGERMYKTGDRARYISGGNIEFLGRLDNQMKIRGHRVELGEIEAALHQHPAVKQSAVVALAHESSSEETLVGYVIPKEQSGLAVSELRAYLREKLPDYMVPPFFNFIDALPLTPNGKIDRKALPPPGEDRPALNQRLVESRTEIEELVAQIWRAVLKLERIGVFDNFFDLGGHSLLAARVVARLEASFNVDLPLRKLFELPTIAGLAEHVEVQRREQRGFTAQPILPVPRGCPLPLGFSQRRLWFLSNLDPGLTSYNIPAAFRITGALSISALRDALNEIIKRHETLRTRLVEIDGQPFQAIVSEVFFDLPVVDLSGLSPDEIIREVERQLLEDARQPYDLSLVPLLRAKLLRVSEEDHVLSLNIHHIICDGSSLVVFYRELATLYEARLGDDARQLTPLPIQYADYAVWQTGWLSSEEMGSQLAYWKQQLGTGFSTLTLPTDYDRQPAQTYKGARQSILLSDELSKALKDLSSQQGVTLFMTLLAAFNILLSRLSGQDDIVIGSTIAGRGRRETEGLIGFFINAIALRTDLSGNPTFLELLKRVREVCLDAYTHQDLPFEKLVEEINPPRDFTRNPIFDVLFNMVDTSDRVFSLSGCEVTKISHDEPGAKFDIVVHAPVVNGRIELSIVYNVDLFSDRRIKLLLQQFEYLLLQITQEPGSEIDRFSIALPALKANFPDLSRPLDDTWEGAIHELFSDRARITPENLAVIDPEVTWTYRELDQRSTELAHHLAAKGVRPKDIVAIYAHRSAPLVVALLGVLKAGAAFTILDPMYPPTRLTAYLRIAQPKGWIQMDTRGSLPEQLATCLNKLNLSCRLNLPRGKQEPIDFLREHPGVAFEVEIKVGAGDPAYIAFTSGSTGEPKGVLGRHGPITHFLPWQIEVFDLHETDRFCLLSGLAYNHLHRDIFTALYLGATLYVPPPEVVREPELLMAWLRTNGISVLHLTPALGQLLLTAAAQPLPAVRRIFFGGDVLPRGEVARVQKLAPNATIGCFYGTTETQRAVGYYGIRVDFEANHTESNRPIPLGRGIKNVQLLLLNKSGQLAGIGEVAELYVRSPHLAEGYIGDEALTNERFISNPLTNDPKDRLYRTGELGRYLPDGNVEWAGRTDRRVNIRGFRVELEEIESVLKQHPAVKDAAVLVQEYETSSAENANPETRIPKPNQRLLAYVAAEEPSSSTADLLQSYLSTRLPDYMIPGHFVVFEQLPLNPSGKVDYRALPPVQQFPAAESSLSQAPRSEVEAKLSVIFCQVLGRQQVGIAENFFRLGGHSLLAAQAAARIREAFSVGLELRTFLESPTIAELAKEIAARLQPADTTPCAEDPDREEIEL